MKRFSSGHAAVIVCLILLALYLLIFSGIPPVPLLLVIAFLGLTIKFTRDGINQKQTLLTQVQINEQALRSVLINNNSNLLKNSQDKINRLALIEKICSEDQAFQLWEKGKREYQLLPNFLLALGLLGTFLGITMNLFLISRRINGKVDLQTVLPDVIGSMAIAFVSSLAALASSAFLTKFHPSYELDIEKDKLLTSLEHYLDNDFFISQNQPNLQQKIDELIKSMNTYSQNIDIFVKSLPQNTQKFQEAVTEASNTLTKSANNFRGVTGQSSQAMQTSANSLSNATSSLASLTTTFSDLTSSLHKSTQSLDQTTKELHRYLEESQTTSTALVNNSSRVQSLIQNNQQNLGNISQQLVQNTTALSAATQSFNTNASQVTESLEQYTGQVKNHNNRLQNVSEKIEFSAQMMMQIQNKLEQIVTSLSQLQNL